MPEELRCRIPVVRIAARFRVRPGKADRAALTALLSQRWLRVRTLHRPGNAHDAWPAPGNGPRNVLVAECVPYSMPRGALAARLETLLRLRRLFRLLPASGLEADLYATGLRHISVPFPGGAPPDCLDPASTVIGFVPSRSDRAEVFRLADGASACCYAKVFTASGRPGLQREITARRILADCPVAAIIHRDGRTLWINAHEDFEVWRGGLFSFYPRKAARAAFALLGACAQRGYAMIDVGPAMFLYRRDGAIMAIDFEFFSPARKAPGYRESADFTGELASRFFTHGTGYGVYWPDALGASYDTIMAGSDAALAIGRLRHLLAKRLPGRAREGFGRGWRNLLALEFAVRHGSGGRYGPRSTSRPASRNAGTGGTPPAGSPRRPARPRQRA